MSMQGRNDHAYGVPLSYVYLGNSIYFHCAVEGKKLDLIRCNNKVSFCVVGPTQTLPDLFSVQYSSAIVFGLVNEVDGKEKLGILMAFLEKYSGNFFDQGKEYILANGHKTAVIKLEIAHMTGKAGR